MTEACCVLKPSGIMRNPAVLCGARPASFVPGNGSMSLLSWNGALREHAFMSMAMRWLPEIFRMLTWMIRHPISISVECRKQIFLMGQSMKCAFIDVRWMFPKSRHWLLPEWHGSSLQRMGDTRSHCALVTATSLESWTSTLSWLCVWRRAPWRWRCSMGAPGPWIALLWHP